MAKAKKTAEPISTINDTTKKAFSDHVATMTGHLIDSAQYSGHGHFTGNQGGHPMPENSGAHLQRHAFIPPAVGSHLPKRNSTGSAASGAYQIENTGTTGDCDSAGATGY